VLIEGDLFVQTRRLRRLLEVHHARTAGRDDNKIGLRGHHGGDVGGQFRLPHLPPGLSHQLDPGLDFFQHIPEVIGNGMAIFIVISRDPVLGMRLFGKGHGGGPAPPSGCSRSC